MSAQQEIDDLEWVVRRAGLTGDVLKHAEHNLEMLKRRGERRAHEPALNADSA